MNINHQTFPVPSHIHGSTWCTRERYLELYKQSIEKPDEFWATQAKILDWMKPWNQVSAYSFESCESDIYIRWYEGGRLNATYNCVDRHARQNPERIAILWEPDAPDIYERKITYNELFIQVSRAANALKANGVKKGDRVTIYLPMIPEAVIAMLACARIGAIHSVVFAGFSAEALASRIQDCQSTCVITADSGTRGGKTIPLKQTVYQILDQCPSIKTLFVIQSSSTLSSIQEPRELDWEKELIKVSSDCPPEPMDSEDALFILYTSGSTGKPKGVLHTTGGYLVYAALTHQYVFDYHSHDIYWCTADIGWITGHTYLVYGPLANGATLVMHEGTPTYPTFSRHWEIVDKYGVTIYYTSPTAIRSLMREGDRMIQKTSRQSLRILGSVGEPINPAVWLWYYHKVGNGKCPIVDTWWQTETGGILISPLPGATDLKPGSASWPFFGIKPVIVGDNGKILEGACSGNLCFATSWPGQMRSIFGDPKRFHEIYFSQVPGLYFAGDCARRDEEGYYWLTGRADDVLKVSGHRLSTTEIESALVSHSQVAEAAVVGCPHAVKGEAIYGFVTLKAGIEGTEELQQELKNHVRVKIGPIATPESIQWAPALPKTRSGKIMRRILRKIASGEAQELGDTTTLADPSVIDRLIQERRK